MKKVLSVVGARPNFMKVAPLHRAFKKYADAVTHYIVHTGQHYDVNMSDAFFRDLDIPEPDFFLGVGSASHAVQTANIMIKFEKVLLDLKPDLVIVVGDVNSTIACALTSIKLGVKVAHVEAGLRSFDRDMPEEINRIATDSICDYCFVTEQSGVENLLNENFPEDRIYLTGNTMIDSQYYARPKAEKSEIVLALGLNGKKYAALTIHRPSNVDDPDQLNMLFDVFDHITKTHDVVLPVHPRTLKNIENFGFAGRSMNNSRLHLIEPLGYTDFLSLMLNSDFVITDSGGIQEETTVLGIPCLTIRTTTERPVTCEIGTNELVIPEYKNLIKAADNLIKGNRKKGEIPPLWDGHAGERIAEKIVGLI